MPDAPAIDAGGDNWRARLGDLWHEVRHGEGPTIAPYPERALVKPSKWDRPLDKLIGRILVDPPFMKNRLADRAQAIIDGFTDLRDLSDEAFAQRCAAMRSRLMREGLCDALVDECLALIREATGRHLGMWHHRVQLIGGLIMLQGGVAEMATGEGKTITALLPAVTAALAGTPTHVFTVNDYLAERDLAKLEPVYRQFGLTTGLIIADMEPPDRQAAYRCDVVYGTNKEIAFDYLRDKAQLRGARGAARRKLAELFGRAAAPLTMRGLYFAIVDEADSIFIDEARTPLILSTEIPADDGGLYLCALELGAMLEEGRHYVIKAAERTIELTDAGRAAVADLSAGLPQRPWRIRQAREQLAIQALSATLLFLRDREYVVSEGKVMIVDESTGRTMPDRSWEGGLHQLVEVKEQVEQTGERITLARVTYQQFFRRYRRLAGMSGTVREVAGELWADFGLRITPVPTNKPVLRSHQGHLLVRDQEEKWRAVADAVVEIRVGQCGRPVLIGTRSVADSECVAAELMRRQIAHRVLNARQDGDEAEIIAAAGQMGAVTVATNMAGRGTDIELSTTTREAGGLHVILTSFHETQRVDRQLFGRAGRQGDPGSVEAITALDDDLYSQFARRGAAAVLATVKQWPVHDGPAEWLRKWAQSKAEQRHAAERRQVELAEEQTRRSLAFSGND